MIVDLESDRRVGFDFADPIVMFGPVMPMFHANDVAGPGFKEFLT
jgi:hypothetical protein